jgi:hypothetical protein
VVGAEAPRLSDARARRRRGDACSRTRRFEKGEEKNDPALARQAFAQLGDLYVNDAFGCMHRAHASTEGVAKHLRPAVAGLLVEKELDYARRPALDEAGSATRSSAILGGARRSRGRSTSSRRCCRRWIGHPVRRRRDGVHVLARRGQFETGTSLKIEAGSRSTWRRDLLDKRKTGYRLTLHRTIDHGRGRRVRRGFAKAHAVKHGIPAA